LRTHAIPERFCSGDSLRRGAISSVCTFTFYLYLLLHKAKSTYLIGITVFNDFCAQIAAGNSAEILLIALAIARVLVQHERRPGLDLCADDVIPQLA